MKKDKNEQEIRRTRVGGFGGSDAAMMVSIAERITGGQPLTTTQKHRVRIAKGLETPPPEFTSPEIEEGRRFEDRAAKELQGWERETYLTPLPNTMTEPQNFKVFAHADFFYRSLCWVKECKWSRKFDHKGLQKEYKWQLQWYYMLGEDNVSLVTDTADGLEVSDIKRDAKAVETLREAVNTLDAAWHDLDLTITEKSTDELPPEIASLVEAIKGLKNTQSYIEATLKQRQSELLEWMETNEMTKVWNPTASITYTPASHTVGFDAKAFEKEHADLYAAYRTKVTKKSAYLTVKINKNNE